MVIIPIMALSAYGYYHPPIKEPKLSEMREDIAVRFQYFPLRVLSILPNRNVLLGDRFGNQAMCIPFPTFEAHPVLKRTHRIDAQLIMKEGKCYLLKSFDGSGYRSYKIILSLLSLFVVSAVFLSNFRFDRKEFIFKKRDNYA